MDSNLQILFDQKHKLTKSQLAALDSNQHKQLVHMAEGTLAAPDRTVAIDALVRIAPSLASQVLNKTLIDRMTPLYLRAVAATQLGRLGGKNAEKVLIKSLDVEKDTFYQLKVAAALGKNGTSSSFQALEKMSRQRKSISLRRQAKLGLMLVGFRNKQAQYLPPKPKKALLMKPHVTESLSCKGIPAKKKFLRNVFEDIQLDSYGIQLSETTGIRFQCGRNRLLMLLNNEIMGRRALQKFQKEPVLFGLIAQQAPTDESWATRFLFFAWPKSKKTTMLSSYRTDGYQMMFGSLDIKGEDGNIGMVAVRDGANTPSLIKGKIMAGTIVIDELRTERKVQGKRFLKESLIPIE